MSSEPQAYPLQWPLGHPRTPKPRKSQFVATMATARDGVLEQLRLWKASGVVISSNAPLMKGKKLPYATFPAPEDAGVAVYFQLNGELKVIPCDEYLTVGENMRAIQYVIEALRTIERHGGTGVFSTAFSGFQALPAKGETTGAKWYDLLQLSPNATEEEINGAFKRLSKIYHPDVPGGSHELMARLTQARRDGICEIKSTG